MVVIPHQWAPITRRIEEDRSRFDDYVGMVVRRDCGFFPGPVALVVDGIVFETMPDVCVSVVVVSA